MTPLEKAVVDYCEKLHSSLSALEDQAAQIEDKQNAHGVLLSDIMSAVGSLSDMVRQQYDALASGLSNLGARVRTSEQLMKAQKKPRAVNAIEVKKGRNESDDR